MPSWRRAERRRPHLAAFSDNRSSGAAAAGKRSTMARAPSNTGAARPPPRRLRPASSGTHRGAFKYPHEPLRAEGSVIPTMVRAAPGQRPYRPRPPLVPQGRRPARCPSLRNASPNTAGPGLPEALPFETKKPAGAVSGVLAEAGRFVRSGPWPLPGDPVATGGEGACSASPRGKAFAFGLHPLGKKTTAGSRRPVVRGSPTIFRDAWTADGAVLWSCGIARS